MTATRVVVLGSGFAALETAFRLRSLITEDSADITVVSEQDEFLFRPNVIQLPFGGAEKPLHVSLARPLSLRRIRQRIATVEGVDPALGIVHTSKGLPVHYDRLVIATGTGIRPEEVPGLERFAHQICLPGQLHRLGEDLRSVARNAKHGRPQRVLCLVPPGNWSAAPLYELALMLDTWLRRRDIRHQVDLTFSTVEDGYLQAFGPKVHEAVLEEFARRRIHGSPGSEPVKVTEEEVTYTHGAAREFDVLITSPPRVPSVRYEGMPTDRRGFLRCEPTSRAVIGFPEIFAPGDAGDFPVKQSFLALLQGDAVAREIAGVRRDTGFDPTALCLLDMGDRALFARAPLMLTGDERCPVDVDPEAYSDYRVGTGPGWRVARKVLDEYLTLRFRAGLPFLSGAGWTAMDLAFRAGSRLFAR